jgi:DNA-binding response OmpR family regulator
VVITGDYSAELRARSLNLGTSAYLRKPVDEAMLLAAIKVALRGDAPPSSGP